MLMMRGMITKMKITKRQLRRIIRESFLKEQDNSSIETVGDLRAAIAAAKGEKRKQQGKEAVKDFASGFLADLVPGLGMAKSLFDVVKSTYDMDDSARTGTALDALDVDDDVSAIVDDPIENKFLEAIATEIEGQPDDTPLESLNMTKALSTYLEGEFNARTVAGFEEGKKLKITKRQLRGIIREQVEEELEPTPPEELGPNPVVQTVLNQMEDMSIDDLRIIWHAVADTYKRKQNELKSGFKKGDRVAWTKKSGEENTGTVVRRGGKFVMVQPDGDHRTWKKWPSSLRVIE
jgi:hypothetical protein